MTTDAERQQLREEVIEAINKAWVETSESQRQRLDELNIVMRSAYAMADEAQADINKLLEESYLSWDAALDKLRMPVKAGGTVVPWTRHRTPQELIIGLGDDEYFVIYSDGTRHLFGASPRNDGYRVCRWCDRGVIMPPYELAVIPEYIPDAIRAAAKEFTETVKA